MPRRKKTSVERISVTPSDDWQLIDHLWYAVYRTCRQLGWDMMVPRRTESFCKIEAWLPFESGPLAIGFVDVYLDLMTPGKLVRALANNADFGFFGRHWADEEARAFLDRLYLEFQQTLEQWVNQHGEAEWGRIHYLLTGRVLHDNPAKAATRQVHTGEANPRQRRMTAERQKRAWAFRRIKDDNPAMSYVQVALAARSQGFADADGQDVKNDYRAMGWQWERAERSR